MRACVRHFFVDKYLLYLRGHRHGHTPSHLESTVAQLCKLQSF